MIPTKILVVAGVVVRVDASGPAVLCAQRRSQHSEDGLWEFPGGKCEPREAPRAAVLRELGEELRIRVHLGAPLVAPTTSGYWPINATYELAVWWASLAGGVPRVGHDHHDVRFLRPEQLPHLSWLEADVPVMLRVVHELTLNTDSCLRP